MSEVIKPNITYVILVCRVCKLRDDTTTVEQYHEELKFAQKAGFKRLPCPNMQCSNEHGLARVGYKR